MELKHLNPQHVMDVTGKAIDEISRLRAENAELKAKNAQIEDDVAFWKKKLDDEMASRRDEYEKSEKEIRRLKRALYKACSNWAKSERYTEATWHGDEHRELLWASVQAKCLSKTEEYK